MNSHSKRCGYATNQNESQHLTHFPFNSPPSEGCPPQVGGVVVGEIRFHEKKTVFLDRDGVINEKPKEHDYVKTWDEFHFLRGAPEALVLFNRADYRVVIVSNQRGVARGIVMNEQIETIHEEMQKALMRHGATVDGIYVCPHEVGTCACRKPEIGLFLQAETDAPVDKEHSYMVGDSQGDITAGKRYGIKTVLINAGEWVDFGQDLTYATLFDAANAIIKEGIWE